MRFYHRYWLAPLLIASVLGIGACHRGPSAGADIDPSLKDYIPPNSKALLGLSVEKLKHADFYKRHQAQLALAQLDRFSSQTGVDPRRDLSSFMVAWDGANSLAMVRGSFNEDAVTRRLQASGAPSQRYNKVTLYGRDGGDMVLLPHGIVIAGPLQMLKKSLDQNATGEGVIPEDLQSQLTRINADAQLWAATSGVISLKNMGVRGDTAMNLANILDYVNASALGVTLGSGLSLDAHITCISEQGSQRVNDALRGVIGLARLSTPDAQLDQLKIWDSIHVEKQGKEVHVTAILNSDLADKALTLIGSVNRRF